MFKVFYGNASDIRVDDKINDWLKENSDVTIVDWKFQMSRYGYASICIEYEKTKKVIEDVAK